MQTLGEVPAELSLTPEADARLPAQAGGVPDATVVRLLELLGEALEAVKAGAEPRTQPGAGAREGGASPRSTLRRRRCSRASSGSERAATAPCGSDAGAPRRRRSPAVEPRSAAGSSLCGEAASAGDAARGAPPAPCARSTLAANDLRTLIVLWPAVVELVGGENALFARGDRRPAPVGLAGEDLTVAFRRERRSS